MEQYVWLIILSLAQAVLIALKIIEKRKEKNGQTAIACETGHDCPENLPCAQHGERLAALETEVKNINKKLDRIEGKVNGIGK